MFLTAFCLFFLTNPSYEFLGPKNQAHRFKYCLARSIPAVSLGLILDCSLNFQVHMISGKISKPNVIKLFTLINPQTLA